MPLKHRSIPLHLRTRSPPVDCWESRESQTHRQLTVHWDALLCQRGLSLHPRYWILALLRALWGVSQLCEENSANKGRKPRHCDSLTAQRSLLSSDWGRQLGSLGPQKPHWGFKSDDSNGLRNNYKSLRLKKLPPGIKLRRALRS